MLLITYVVDSSVLTDLEAADVLLEAPLMPRFDLAVPDLIQSFGEAEKHDACELEKYDFAILESGEMELVEDIDHARGSPELGLRDVWALYLCDSRGLKLLTRSPQLAKAARDVGVVVHSTLWLLDKMVAAGCLSPWGAVAAVDRTQEAGCGLDEASCARFREKWRRST